jgi:hypothetical protein
MKTAEYQITFPDTHKCMEQDEEWVILENGEDSKKIRLHDYADLYSIPGLYEELVYKKLKCNSPNVVCDMLKEELEKAGAKQDGFRVLDFGAGNGIVGECIDDRLDCTTKIGIDIIPEARKAVLRDRPYIYDDYYVMDLADLGENEEKILVNYNFNVLVTVAALGFNDIPTRAFINAFNLLKKGSWVAFNIKDKFLSDNDTTGFHDTIHTMTSNSLEILKTKRYRHRFALNGESLYYVAVVGRKLKNVND